MLEGPYTAVFAGARRTPETLLRKSLGIAARRGYDLDEGPNLVERLYDETTDRYRDGKAVRIDAAVDALEWAERWDGAYAALRGLGLEVLRAGPAAPLLLLHEQAEAYRRKVKDKNASTRFAGFMMDIYFAAEAASCVYAPGLVDLPSAEWAARAANAGQPAIFRILPAGDPRLEDLTPGLKRIRLTGGALLLTSLPVKNAPGDENP